MSIEFITCLGCGGSGTYDIGDVEDGIEEICEECGGDGIIENPEGLDLFNPERDAWMANN